MKNYRSFTVTYVPQTNYKPSRVKIYDNRNKVWKFISYHSGSLDRVEDIASEHLQTLGIYCPIVSQAKKGFLLLTENFQTKIK